MIHELNLVILFNQLLQLLDLKKKKDREMDFELPFLQSQAWHLVLPWGWHLVQIGTSFA